MGVYSGGTQPPVVQRVRDVRCALVNLSKNNNSSDEFKSPLEYLQALHDAYIVSGDEVENRFIQRQFMETYRDYYLVCKEEDEPKLQVLCEQMKGKLTHNRQEPGVVDASFIQCQNTTGRNTLRGDFLGENGALQQARAPSYFAVPGRKKPLMQQFLNKRNMPVKADVLSVRSSAQNPVSASQIGAHSCSDNPRNVAATNPTWMAERLMSGVALESSEKPPSERLK